MNMKSSHDNLKPKEGEGAKAGELNASKGWFDNFRKKFGFKLVKITGNAASANQEAADELPDSTRNIRGENSIFLDRFLLQMKCPLLGVGGVGEQGSHKGHSLGRKRSEDQELIWQAEIRQVCCFAQAPWSWWPGLAWSIKLLTSSLEEKRWPQLPSLGCTAGGPRQQEPFSWIGSTDTLSHWCSQEVFCQ